MAAVKLVLQFTAPPPSIHLRPRMATTRFAARPVSHSLSLRRRPMPTPLYSCISDSSGCADNVNDKESENNAYSSPAFTLMTPFKLVVDPPPGEDGTSYHITPSFYRKPPVESAFVENMKSKMEMKKEEDAADASSEPVLYPLVKKVRQVRDEAYPAGSHYIIQIPKGRVPGFADPISKSDDLITKFDVVQPKLE